MKTVDKVLLVLLSILVLPVGVAAIGLGVGAFDSGVLMGFIDNIAQHNIAYMAVLVAYGAIVVNDPHARAAHELSS